MTSAPATGRPRVTWVFGSTLDGRVAAPDGSSRWISSRAARADAHRLRAIHDAVLVGSGAARTDDPHLGLRHGVAGTPPLRVVLDARASIVGPSSRVVDDAAPDAGGHRSRRAGARPAGPGGHRPRPDRRPRPPRPPRACSMSSRRAASARVLVEGGPTIAAAFLRSRPRRRRRGLRAGGRPRRRPAAARPRGRDHDRRPAHRSGSSRRTSWATTCGSGRPWAEPPTPSSALAQAARAAPAATSAPGAAARATRPGARTPRSGCSAAPRSGPAPARARPPARAAGTGKTLIGTSIRSSS